MNDNIQDTTSTDAGVAEATVQVFNPETGEFETRLAEEVGTVTSEGEVASAADVTVH